MNSFENKTALVTSAGRGIGLACALKLAAGGASVYLGVRNMEAAEKICAEYQKNQFHMIPVYFDATDTASYRTMINHVTCQSHQLDILINNFGTGNPETDLDLVGGDEETFFNIMNLNLGSVYRITKLAIPFMIKQGSGSIINISSIGGAIPDVTRIGYGVSKAAINNITQQIALQYAKNNIRCNAVLPGLTATDAALNNMPERFIKSFLSHVPLKRIGSPEDIANIVAFLASDDSSYITGQILEAAGGYGLGTPQYADIMRNQL